MRLFKRNLSIDTSMSTIVIDQTEPLSPAIALPDGKNFQFQSSLHYTIETILSDKYLAKLSCGICLEDFVYADKVLKLSCGHYFHFICSQNAAQSTGSPNLCFCTKSRHPTVTSTELNHVLSITDIANAGLIEEFEQEERTIQLESKYRLGLLRLKYLQKIDEKKESELREEIQELKYRLSLKEVELIRSGSISKKRSRNAFEVKNIVRPDPDCVYYDETIEEQGIRTLQTFHRTGCIIDGVHTNTDLPPDRRPNSAYDRQQRSEWLPSRPLSPSQPRPRSQRRRRQRVTQTPTFPYEVNPDVYLYNIDEWHEYLNQLSPSEDEIQFISQTIVP